MSDIIRSNTPIQQDMTPHADPTAPAMRAGRGRRAEMEAWQVEIDVAEHLGYYKLMGWNESDIAVKNANTVLEFSQAIREHDKGYWNVFHGTPLKSLFCAGLCSLPYYPFGIMLGQ